MAHPSFGERALYAVGHAIFGLIYRVTKTGVEHLPTGGFLLLPNHISFVDAIVLLLACPRKIRFIIDEAYYRHRILHPFLKLGGCIPITPRKAKEAMRAAADRIRAGEIVCLFPEGQLSRSGSLLRLRRGYELIARQAEAPVVPVWLDELWGSIFSFKGGRFFTKWPQSLPYRVAVAFGKPLDADHADIATVREELLKLGEACYTHRPVLRQHLAYACLRGLKRAPFGTAIIDGLDHSTLSRGKLLGVATALARHLRQRCPEPRIGVVLPPGKGGVVANLAVMLAGKIPVNLNFTSSSEAIRSAQSQAGLRTIISARPMAKKLENFPWTPEVLHLDEVLPAMKPAILAWWLVSLVTPARLLAALLHVPRLGDRTEAILLFTSGSSGMPKGVPLTHRNIVGNVSQFSMMLSSRPDDLIVASLPFFHSFGCTVTLWYPLIEGVKIVTYPSPLEAAKIAALVEKYAATIMFGTPTFLRAYLRKAEPPQLRSLRLLITGAEKLQSDIAEAFEQRFGKPVYEGYGLTETSPVVSVNLPSPRPAKEGDAVQPSSRAGSTGKMAPGIAAEIRDPESGTKLSLHETGMLWLRGPNIFEGYLDDPARSAEVLHDGWFKTGDLGRFDEDGFLFIDGRLSRFSKMGGEMVPHELVEQKILTALNLDANAERLIAVMGVTDEAKGEALVLLSSIEIDSQQLRAALRAAEVPNLWVPRTICRVDEIPVLASGKLDLGKCKDLAGAA
ncbi:MAG: Long-chain-fatty-acid--CoA ligase [uncultured Chthoniobacterales bacterium]|uniref:Long-chain-fatty-acid--CoA ligase n=1 Tax=uncultured Chthoniobacterales bacterium TaxID=1836801 RepID=A0A6J4IIG5_9BACT|nr:MAG: Long-chain-fatty-acid--CoA ligase [uncultured Chthoniobacterales bacterium]